MTFGDKLKTYRTNKDMSQDELAKLLGTSKQVLSRYENNQRTPKITVAQEYAEKLGLPLSYLIDDNQTSLDQKATDKTEFNYKIINNVDFLEKLRIAREKAGLTQQQAADKTGIGYKTINNYENGVSRPDVEKLAALCKAYNVSADYFLNLNETATIPYQSTKDEPAPAETDYCDTPEELMRRAQKLKTEGGGRRILAYGGMVEDDSLASKIKALERQRSHSRDEDSDLLFQTKRQESGAILFGYNSNGEWTNETLTAKEAEVVFNLIKSLKNLS